MNVLWGLGEDADQLERWEPPGGWNPAFAECDRIWAENYWRWLRLIKKMDNICATQETMCKLFARRWVQD